MTNKLKYFILIIIFLIISFNNVYTEYRIKHIYINRLDVFDSTDNDWFFAAKLANSLHWKTREYVVKDEILFNELDELDMDLLEETVRNLRATNLFTNVKVELDSVGPELFDVYVITKDKWTTQPSFLFGTGGNTTNIGVRMEELNLFGTSIESGIEALHRTENNTGWQGKFRLYQRRFLSSDYSINGSLAANKYRTEEYFSFSHPYLTLNTDKSFGFNLQNVFGKDLFFKPNTEFLPFHDQRLQMWYSGAWMRKDRVFATAFLELDDVNRAKPEWRQAFDNSGKILFGFSSISQEFYQVTKLNTFLVQDLPVGGWGTAILGKIFPIGSKGENYYYVGGQGEKSYYKKGLYLFGQISAGSAFAVSQSQYTYQDFTGLGFYQLSDKSLIAARFRQQTSWDWNAMRQLILDNDAGLRGYEVNQLVGQNRIVANIEYRYFNDWQFWIFKISGTLFYDTGTVWDQQFELGKTRWHNAAGFGVRIYNMKSTGSNGIFRIDFAFNFDKKKLGEIIFTSDQLFSVFQQLTFKLPQLMGREFDYE